MSESSATSGGPRRVSQATRQIVLMESGYKCANPNCRHILTLEIHHIKWVRDGGGNKPENLLALCPNCHSLHTQGHIAQEAIRVWKGMLLTLNNPNRESADILIHLHRQGQSSSGRNTRYSGDALLQVAGLLNAGLLEASSSQSSTGAAGAVPQSSFRLVLTEKGLVLVDAWLSGDEEQYESSVADSS